MALIQCRECGKSVSTEAYVCPHCGAPRREPASPPVQPPPLIQQKSSVAEEILYSDKVVTVTPTRVSGLFGRDWQMDKLLYREEIDGFRQNNRMICA